MAHYTITPLEKKSIYIVYEMYRENADGSISTMTIEDHYRWGKGFLSQDDDCNLGFGDDQEQWCKPDGGEYDSCDFEDQVACWFEFSDDVTEAEQEQIKQYYLEGDDNDLMGVGWLYDSPDHEWQEEDVRVIVLGPYKVEYCEEDGTVIREVKLRTRKEWTDLYESLGREWYVHKDSAIEPEKY